MTRRTFLRRGAAVGAAISTVRWIPATALDGSGAVTLGPANRLVALPSAVFGGELQYFRMSPSAIPARLALCREAAFTVVQTYVPWNVHELIARTGCDQVHASLREPRPDSSLDVRPNLPLARRMCSAPSAAFFSSISPAANQPVSSWVRWA